MHSGERFENTDSAAIIYSLRRGAKKRKFVNPKYFQKHNVFTTLLHITSTDDDES